MENKKRCLYSQLENGIAEFVFTESSNAAVDEWIEWLNTVPPYPAASNNGVDRILFDTRQSGPLPMYYAFKRLNEWRQQSASYDPSRPNRTAQLYKSNSFYVTMAKNLLKVFPFPNSRMEYFHENRNAAIAWLLRDD